MPRDNDNPLHRADKRALMMTRMLETVGADRLDEAGAEVSQELAAALRRCLACREARLCRAWLDGRQPGVDHRTFCPNASLFERFGRRGSGGC